MSRTLALVVSVISTTWLAAGAFAAGGGGGDSSAGGGGERSGARGDEQIAAKNYQRARKYIDRALEIEAKLPADASQDDRNRNWAEAEEEYMKAMRSLRSAVSRDAEYYKAHSDMGFVQRKFRDYEAALAAYDRALEIQPEYWEAVEYRGEAYLELGRLDDAKAAYMQLFGEKRALADMLMAKMERWVARRRSDPGALDPAVIDAFAGWVNDRSAIARQTASLGGGAAEPRHW